MPRRFVGFPAIGADTVTALLGQAVNAVTTFVLVLAVARTLGTAGSGQYFLAVTVVTVLSLVAQLGATSGLVRAVPRLTKTGGRETVALVAAVAAVPAAAVGILGASLLFLGASAVGNAVSGGHVAMYLRVFAPVVPIWALCNVILSVFRGLGAAMPYILGEYVLRPTAQVVATVAVVAADPSPKGVAFAWAAPFVIEAAVAGWFLVTYGRAGALGSVRALSTRDGAAAARSYWRFIAPIAAGATIQSVAQRTDVLLLGGLASAGDVGIYSVVLRYVAPAGMLLGATIIAVGPRLSELFHDADHQGANSLYQGAAAAVCIVGLPIYVALVLFAPAAMSVFGTGFARGGAVLAIVGIATLTNLGSGPVVLVLTMGGHSRWAGVVTAAGPLAGLCVDVVLIPPYGMIGAAIGFAISVLISNVCPLLVVYRKYRLHPFGTALTTITFCTLASIAPTGALWRLTPSPSRLVTCAYILVGGVAYLILIWHNRSALRSGMAEWVSRPTLRAAASD